jgi:hypothetical protein
MIETTELVRELIYQIHLELSTPGGLPNTLGR